MHPAGSHDRIKDHQVLSILAVSGEQESTVPNCNNARRSVGCVAIQRDLRGLKERAELVMMLDRVSHRSARDRLCGSLIACRSSIHPKN